MRRLHLATAPLLLAAFFLLFGRGAIRADALPPVEVHAEEHADPGDARTVPTQAATGLVAAAHAELAAIADPREPAPPARPEDLARGLLAVLESWADSGATVFPDLDVDEVGELLTRHPELADLFLSALEGASPRLRAYLVHAFYRIEDPGTRERLTAVARASYPLKERIEEILVDRTLVLSTLDLQGDGEVRSALVNRLGTSVLEDPEVVVALERIIEDDPDARTRSRAIKRLGQLDRPEIRELLLRILRDPQRPLDDRKAAAFRLRDRPDEEIRGEFTTLIGSPGTEVALVRLAALGLRTAGPDGRSVDALLELARRRGGDGPARQNALSSLASIARSAGPDEREKIRERVRGVLAEIAREDGETARELIRHSETTFFGIPDAGPETDAYLLSQGEEGSLGAGKAR